MDIYHNYAELMKNPVFAGIASLWGVSVIGFIFKSVPSKIWGSIMRQITTTVSIDNSRGWPACNDQVFLAFGKWASKQKGVRFSRSFFVSGSMDGSKQTMPGAGTHYFFYKRRLFWYSMVRLQSSGSENEKREFVINLLGRKKDLIDELVDEFYPSIPSTGIKIFRFAKDGWVRYATAKTRPLNTVILNQETKNEIVGSIDEFMASEKWYNDRSIAYKHCHVLYGPPGTGKSSLVRALATEYDLPIFNIMLQDMSDERFEAAMFSVNDEVDSYMKKPWGGIVLIEDFDSSKAVQSRYIPKHKNSDIPVGTSFNAVEMIKLTRQASVRQLGEKSENPDADEHKISMDLERLTLSGMLNTLDGVVGLDRVLIFMTANNLENIDEALLRKGRVDKTTYIGHLTHAEICEYGKKMFPEYALPDDRVFAPIAGSSLQDVFISNKYDPEAFYGALEVVKEATDKNVSAFRGCVVRR